MDERDRSRSPSRRTSRVEQVVGRWLRRSRDSTSRERVLDDGKSGDSVSQDQRSCPIRVTVQIPRDPALNSHGFSVTSQTPAQVQEVTSGGPADGKLVAGDQLLKINNVAVDDLSTEQAADIIRECQDTITITVLRNTVGPKSSFITPEKRAKLKSNPVKVRFAEEVVVNGHSQGNSLLFLPNVLKVYMENGQTKAFKFEPKTTVKDIVLTLKEKLSISRIEHFSLVLEQQYSITKQLLLHEEELIPEVVQRKENLGYRCLFRVCFMPRDPEDLLQEDPVAFEYLYLQSVNDVLQERFAVEMKCNTALRLSALHIQERLASCGQSPKTPLKTIAKDWGIESFVSATLLKNMREKDLRKAISYHMKKSVTLEPKQKLLTVNQARLNYLNEMKALKSYGGKTFSATMMLQDRESTVSLLVGAQYGVSQVINHKLSIMTTLTEFSSITRVELIPESERVSLVKIYLQDIKPITLLLESFAAKDLSCLVAGYCKLFVNPQVCVFPWMGHSKAHRISAEEGYVSRCASDSEDSDTDMDALLAHVTNAAHSNHKAIQETSGAKDKKQIETGKKGEEDVRNERENGQETEEKKGAAEIERGVGQEAQQEPANDGTAVKPDEVGNAVEEEGKNDHGEKDELRRCVVPIEDTDSDSCRTDSRFLASLSSDSMDALEEDDLLAFCSASHPCGLAEGDSYQHNDAVHLSPSPQQQHCEDVGFHSDAHLSGVHDESDPFLTSAALARMAISLPSPPAASDEEEDEESGGKRDGPVAETGEDSSGNTLHPREFRMFTFENDARLYYNICSNVTPDSARSIPRTLSPCIPQEREQGGEEERDTEPEPILQPPPGFGDSSSDDEFFDAQERLTSPEQLSSAAMTRENSTDSSSMKRTLSLSDIGICVSEQAVEEEERGREIEVGRKATEEKEGELSLFRKRSRKRRSFMETDFTSLVSFPGEDTSEQRNSIPNHRLGHKIHVEGQVHGFENNSSDQRSCPTVSCLTQAEIEPADMETKPITPSKRNWSGPHHSSGAPKKGPPSGKASQRKQQLIEMEPDSMEFKPITDLMSAVSPTILAVRSRVEPDGTESSNEGESVNQEERAVGELVERLMASHLFFAKSLKQEDDGFSQGIPDDQGMNQAEDPSQGIQDALKCDSSSQLTETPFSSLPSLPVPTISYTHSLDPDRESRANQDDSQQQSVEPAERIRSQSLSAALGRGGTTCRRNVGHSREPDYFSRTSDSSAQELLSSVSPTEPSKVFLLAPCSSGLLGRLSASTLRGKIRSLPLYLSRSQETIAANANSPNSKPVRRFSETRQRRNEVEVAREATEDMTSEAVPEVTEVKVVTIVSEEVTEVIEEVREVCQPSPQAKVEQKSMLEPLVEPPKATALPLLPNAEVPVKVVPSSVVVTTQSLNGPWAGVGSQEVGELQVGSCPHLGKTINPLNSGCGVFTNCNSKPTDTQPQALPPLSPHGKPDLSCSSVLALGCETVMKSAETPLEVCDCQSMYTNCFSGVLDSSSFDDELTVYEFSCRMQPGETGEPMSIPSSCLSTSPASFSPSSAISSFPRVVLPPSSSTELSPLLSPLDAPDCFLSDPHEDTIATLQSRHYPSPPAGFLALQRDVDTLLAVLAGAMKEQEGLQGMQEHPRDTCAAHFSENKQRLHVEARGLLAGCQKVVRVQQTSEETLQALTESFRSLVQLTGACLCFSSCPRCQERHTQALTGLVDVIRTYREFARAAERVGCSTERRSCHDLSIKLLARQCTALTTSVFCLTQLFRTLTAL